MVSWTRYGEIYDQVDVILVGENVHSFSIVSLHILAHHEVSQFLSIKKRNKKRRNQAEKQVDSFHSFLISYLIWCRCMVGSCFKSLAPLLVG